MTDNTVQLEKILHDHMMGQLPLAAYRQKRARYIKRYIEDCEKDNTLRRTNYPNSTQQYNGQQQASPAQPSDLSIPKVVNKEPGVASALIKFFLIILLIGGAAAVWYLSQNSKQQIQIEPELINPLQTEINEPAINLEQSIGLFVFKFIENDKWDTNSLSDFLVKWKALTRKQQSDLRKSASFLQLSTMLRERVIEQRGLKEIDKNAEKQESLLLWFSSQLSISIN